MEVEKTIGKTFADKLDEVVIHVSQDLSFTRRELVDELGCANFAAAARLGKLLSRLHIHTAAQLNRTDPFSLLRARGIGQTCMFVAMCILDYKQYNVIDWWEFKRDNVVKFSSYRASAYRRAARRKQDVA